LYIWRFHSQFLEASEGADPYYRFTGGQVMPLEISSKLSKGIQLLDRPLDIKELTCLELANDVGDRRLTYTESFADRVITETLQVLMDDAESFPRR
jgi:hypothetical protein